jgi:RND family efflux transporter MFP subunit
VSYIWFVLKPQYSSPRSRVYASWLGWPSVARVLGEPIPVEVEPVTIRSMVKTLSAEGHVDYLNTTPVQSEVDGIVSALNVEAGQEVKKGTMLFRVATGWHSTRLDELLIKQREWELKQAETNLKREQRLYSSASASALSLELATLRMREAESALAVAREQYRNSLSSRSKTVTAGAAELNHDPKSREVEFVSTVDGTVVERRVQLGQNLVQRRDSLGEPLLLIGDRLVFVAAFDQHYASAIKQGDKGRFYLRAFPGLSAEGEVIRITPQVALPSPQRADTAKAAPFQQPPDTFLVWVSVPSAGLGGNKLLSGMNGYCVFERGFRAPAIPESALMRYSGRQGTVLVVDSSNTLTVKEVTYAGTDDGWVAIESGLKPGEQVVIGGQEALRPGDRVKLGQE